MSKKKKEEKRGIKDWISDLKSDPKTLEEAKQKIPKQNGEWYNDFKKKSLKK